MSMYATFGDMLRSLREENGLTLEDAAVKLNSSAGWLAQLEDNKIEVSVDGFEFILNVYGYRIGVLHKSNPLTREDRSEI